jgi:predicted O-methyltransferase YrrM
VSAELDAWFAARLTPDAPTGDPAAVSPLQGKFLHLLARAIGARHVLELGTLHAYSTIWLARALPDGGRVVSLEVDAAAADRAWRNVEDAGVAPLVQIVVGDARDTLPDLVGPFDLVFLDADKQSNPAYLPLILELSRPGTVIVADNLVRSVPGEFVELVAAEPRLEATALQTVGAKGHDGVLIAVVV